MPRISTDKLQPGMVLREDVKDLSGRMLLKADTEIEEKHLRVLRTWGILGVDVVGDEVDTEDAGVELIELPDEITAEIETEVEKRFAGVDASHPAMAALVEIVEGQLVEQYLSELRGSRQ